MEAGAVGSEGGRLQRRRAAQHHATVVQQAKAQLRGVAFDLAVERLPRQHRGKELDRLDARQRPQAGAREHAGDAVEQHHARDHRLSREMAGQARMVGVDAQALAQHVGGHGASRGVSSSALRSSAGHCRTIATRKVASAGWARPRRCQRR